jgi:hypothetical protein
MKMLHKGVVEAILRCGGKIEAWLFYEDDDSHNPEYEQI